MNRASLGTRSVLAIVVLFPFTPAALVLGVLLSGCSVPVTSVARTAAVAARPAAVSARTLAVRAVPVTVETLGPAASRAVTARSLADASELAVGRAGTRTAIRGAAEIGGPVRTGLPRREPAGRLLERIGDLPLDGLIGPDSREDDRPIPSARRR